MTLKNNGQMIIPWDSKTMFHGDVGAAPRSTGDIFTWKKDVLFYVIQMKNNETDCLNYVAILTEVCYVSQTDSSFIIHPKLTLDFQYFCFCLAC